MPSPPCQPAPPIASLPADGTFRGEGLGTGRDWRLKGEGNANAVFSYAGPDRRLHGQVLRVRKAGRGSAAAAEPLEAELWGAIPGLLSPDGSLDREAFCTRVMRPLLGEAFVQEQVEVPLPPQLAASLLGQLRARGRQPPPAALQPRAGLLPDLTLLPLPSQLLSEPGAPAAAACASPASEAAAPGEAAAAVLCLELKPKCGFLPTAAAICPRNAVKRSVPRFRLHQALKAAQGAVTPNWAYDPRDLFSREAARLQRALLTLLANPQNNARLFLGGEAVPEAFLGQAAAAALGAQPGPEALALLARLACAVLLQSGVLDRVLEAQRRDAHDIEAVWPLYASLSGAPGLRASTPSPATATSAPRPAAGGAPPPAAATSAPRPAAGGAPLPAAAQSRPGSGPEPGVHERAVASLLALPRPAQLAALREYLTAAAAKDCSVMLALRRLGPRESCAVGSCLRAEGARWQWRVGVVDLDLKPLSKLRAHWQLDSEVVAAYAAMCGGSAAPDWAA